MIKRLLDALPVPKKPNDWVRLGMAIGVTIYAGYLQYTTGNIPDWLKDIAVGFAAYYFGLLSTYQKKEDEYKAQ